MRLRPLLPLLVLAAACKDPSTTLETAASGSVSAPAPPGSSAAPPLAPTPSASASAPAASASVPHAGDIPCECSVTDPTCDCYAPPPEHAKAPLVITDGAIARLVLPTGWVARPEEKTLSGIRRELLLVGEPKASIQLRRDESGADPIDVRAVLKKPGHALAGKEFEAFGFFSAVRGAGPEAGVELSAKTRDLAGRRVAWIERRAADQGTLIVAFEADLAAKQPLVQEIKLRAPRKAFDTIFPVVKKALEGIAWK